MLYLPIHSAEWLPKQLWPSHAIVGKLLAHVTNLSVVLCRRVQVAHREPAEFVQKLVWEKFLAMHAHERYLWHYLQMGLHFFNILLNKLGDSIRVDNEKASGQGGAIIPEICLFCMLHWMARALYIDLFHLHRNFMLFFLQGGLAYSWCYFKGGASQNQVSYNRM